MGNYPQTMRADDILRVQLPDALRGDDDDVEGPARGENLRRRRVGDGRARIREGRGETRWRHCGLCPQAARAEEEREKRDGDGGDDDERGGGDDDDERGGGGECERGRVERERRRRRRGGRVGARTAITLV